MKIKVISRSQEASSRETKHDVVRVHKNPDPELHPFERAREYRRAVRSVKLDKMFAKPFVGALTGHMDSVFSMAISPVSLVPCITGSCDGEIKVWDLAHRKQLWSTYAHTGFVRGLTVAPDGETFFSCGDDKTLKRWTMSSVPELRDTEADVGKSLRPIENVAAEKAITEPLSVWTSKYAMLGLDHHWKRDLVATASVAVHVWDHNRSEPLQTLTWGADSINAIKFNPAEHDVFASCGEDRSVCLYDIRAETPIRKLVLAMKSNAVAWNPREPFNFTLANEDHNLYTYDMRKLDSAKLVHKDHTNAVMSLAYSPMGSEFVSGSYDKTLRIFPVQGAGKSREVYHTRRMQRIFSVAFTGDAKFVLSASDDTNVRVWKAQKSDKLGRTVARQREQSDYFQSLKRKFEHMPEVRRIAKHQHVPKQILKAKRLKKLVETAAKKREDNKRVHSKEGAVPFKAERKKHTVAELK